MPKIPLYGKGLGTTVQLEAGQLSRRPDMNAFTAAGRGMMGLAETAGQIAFQFGQEQKKNETDRLTSELTAQAFEEAEAYNLGLQETNTEAAATGLRNTVEKPLLNKVDGMNLTNSQKAAVKQNISRTMLTKAVDAKKVAFRNDLTLTSQARNAELATLMSEFSTTSDPEIQAAHRIRANEIINEGQRRGLSLNYSVNSWAKAAGLENLSVALGAATNLSDFDALSEQVNGMDLKASEKLSYQTSIIAQRDKLVSQELDRIEGEVFVFGPDEDEFNSSIEQIQNGQNIVIERDGEVTTISTANIPDNKLKSLAASLRASREISSKEQDRSITDDIAKTIPTMALSDLLALQDATNNGEGPAGDVGLNSRNAINALINSEVSERAPRVKSQIATNSTAIEDILTQDNGVVTPETQKLITETASLFSDIDDEVGAEAFRANLTSVSDAGTIYSTLKYAPPGTVRAARTELVNEKNNATTADERVRAKNTLKYLDAMIAGRSEAMSNDPVAYINSEYKKDQNDASATLTSAQLVQKQVAMGVPAMDIRVLSNQQISDFKTEFDGATNYNEKSEIGTKFLSQFNPEQQSMVMRNLGKDGVLTLVDQMVIANPGNSNFFTSDAANSPEVVESFKTFYSSKERKEFMAAVASSNTNYSASIVGGQVGAMMPRGATDARMLHVSSMNQVVVNTAMYYKMADNNLSIDDATQRAIDAVIGSQFSFGEVNGRPIRMKKGYEGIKNELSSVLQSSLTRNAGKLGFIVEPPEAGNAISAQVYANEISQDGYWVTTTDNSGVYLVDKEGNMVQRKSDPEAPFPSAKDAFIFVSFDEIAGNAYEAQELEQEAPFFGFERKERFDTAADIRRKEIF